MGEELPMPLIGWLRGVLWPALDCLTAGFLLALSVLGALGRVPAFGAPAWLTVTAAVLVAAPLAVRRIWPAGVFAVAAAANAVLAVAAVGGNPAIAVALALYIVAVRQPPRRSLAALAAALAVTIVAEAAPLLAGQGSPNWPAAADLITASVVVLAAAWALGAAVRAQRFYAARTAEQLAHRAVAHERLCIARELHDVITHSMSLITVKASVASYLIDSRPEEVPAALAVIETTGRHALTELRRMLGVLRAEGEPGSLASRAGDERAPVPGLADVALLAEHAAQAGVRVVVDLPADGELPAGVALAAYRIVQEALTNVVKHAAPTRCRIRIDCTRQDVGIEVTDEGHGPRARPAAAGGHGIIGMRERTALFGGEFEAGPGPHGGFRVCARLPLAVSDSAALAEG